MIVTTTNSVEGHQITDYLGIVTGEAVSGINMFRDLGAGIRNVFGGRSAGYEEELQQARNEVLAEMQQRAEALGADAVVGASIGRMLSRRLDEHRIDVMFMWMLVLITAISVYNCFKYAM